MLNCRQKLGRFGEDLAKSFLIKRGYHIIERNYHTPYGEIDIICRNQGCLVFVEVKTRRSKKHGLGEETIGPQKKRSIRDSIEYYLNSVNSLSPRYRCDLISIEIEKNLSKIRQIKAINLE